MAESIKDVASSKDLERLEKALDFSNTMKTFNLNKNNLKVKTQNLLSYSTAGGSFTVDQSLISFMNFVVSPPLLYLWTRICFQSPKYWCSNVSKMAGQNML